jgi:hypothetical protein
MNASKPLGMGRGQQILCRSSHLATIAVLLAQVVHKSVEQTVGRRC